MNRILMSILTALIAVSVYGETPADSVKVYFRVGHRIFDPKFFDNGARMNKFIDVLTEANDKDIIDSIVVRGMRRRKELIKLMNALRAFDAKRWQITLLNTPK